MKSETFRKQALSLIIFFVAVAAVFFVASRLRGDPAEKQAQTILTLLLSSSDAVEPAADDSYTASEPGLVQVDDRRLCGFLSGTVRGLHDATVSGKAPCEPSAHPHCLAFRPARGAHPAKALRCRPLL